MGLLTDPSLSQRNQLGRNLIKHTRKICLLLYVAAIAWFCCLGHKDFNHGTYLSENALSPGLVYSEIKQESGHLVQQYLDELKHERTVHKSGIPYSWLIAKMKQIGLETYTHNFTLNYPLGGGRVFHGKNVYGILRAPRSSSTEGIVFSAPYRPPDSVHTEITASVPVLLAFAQFARRKNYWAKDLIFLVTDQEQLGMHAWLEAYYKGGLESNSILEAGNLPARSGALQAALNIEIQGLDIEYIDVKLEGLNGQLPNLDMYNLVQRITVRENIISGYKQTPRKRRSASQTTVKQNLQHIVSMIFSQANGVPTGNHGLYHRYRIESLTLEAVKRNDNYSSRTAVPLLKAIEGISRSLNNLLERFHQSFFFYILVQNDRFVSIGDFAPCLVLMAGALYIKAFFLWLDLGDSVEAASKESKNATLPYIKVGLICTVLSVLGLLAKVLPTNKPLSDMLSASGLSTEAGIAVIISAISLVGFVFPFFVSLTPNGKELLHILALLHLGSSLIAVGLLNFALGIILATVSTPLAIAFSTKCGKDAKFFSTLYTFLLQPLILVYAVVLVLTLIAFPELGLKAVAYRAVGAAMDGITFSVVDSLIYGNWLYTAITIAFFPSWLMFWSLSLIRNSGEQVAEQKLKTN